MVGESQAHQVQSPYEWGTKSTPYDEIGGSEGVRALVEAFYDRVAAESPSLRAMHPHDDWGSRQKLYEFLSGWMGGPQLYTERHGHPMLRMRHAPFPIDEAASREWLRCMGLAMDDVGTEGELRIFLEQRFAETAEHMRNR